MVLNRIPFTYIEYAPAIYGHLHYSEIRTAMCGPATLAQCFYNLRIVDIQGQLSQKIIGTAKSKLLQVYFHHERRSVSSSLSMTSSGHRK